MTESITPTTSRRAGAAVHPRPQLTRRVWRELDGGWGFASDDGDIGLAQRWFDDPAAFTQSIVVPFPPESDASGIAARGFHPVVWYRREVTADDVRAAGHGAQGERMMLHFGAVDYVADAWLAGCYLGRHEGGQTPFSFDITHVVAQGTATSWPLVVRAADDPLDVAQPRGKQDWRLEPHGIWYQRTTGIWQPVWLEAVPRTAVTRLSWVADLATGSVTMSLDLGDRPKTPVTVTVLLSYEGRSLAELTFRQPEPRSRTVINLHGQTNGQEYESLLWSPENPRLLDASVQVRDGDGGVDEIRSYCGLRSVGWSKGHFLLNDRPYYLRGVLAQGYWQETHLAAPSADALRAEVELIKDLGFNFVRLHQKIEDPRFLYWTDRLGMLVWGESASAFEFSPTSVERMTREWMEVIRRDLSHPSVAVWVPLNESWGVQHLAHDQAQLSYAQMLYHLTKALDPSRPAVSNDGWEHADSDLWTVHDYGTTRAEVAANYVDHAAIQRLLSGIGPLGRTMKLLSTPDRGQPVIVSEFGGVSYAPTDVANPWGYVTSTDVAEFECLLRDMFEAVQASPVLAGFCYTQLTDTLQEANGLCDPDRKPKLPVDVIRGIVAGITVDTSGHCRPKVPVERPTPPQGS